MNLVFVVVFGLFFASVNSQMRDNVNYLIKEESTGVFSYRYTSSKFFLVSVIIVLLICFVFCFLYGICKIWNSGSGACNIEGE